MATITLTIDGQQASGKAGDTVLDVCVANGIALPTLCHFRGLSDVGACRLCLVEIEKERNLVPACTHPAREGQVVSTKTDRLQKYRRMVLELLFTERNHLCAYCVASGDCELQDLAYKYQMDNARYAYAWPEQTLDSSHPSLVLDHNRCVLCGRCVRTCDEITGAHALDFGKRGWKTNIYADINQPLGESSCISCGGCFQVCPTGAVFSKVSAYRGRPAECSEVESTCPVCGTGCEIRGLVKNNNLLRVDSPDVSKPRGLLCGMGRFGYLHARPDRIKTPLKRDSKNRLVACSYEEALGIMAARLAADSRVAGLASPAASTEVLTAFNNLMSGALGSKLIDTLDGDDYRNIVGGMALFGGTTAPGEEACLEDILSSSGLLVIGANPMASHPVVGSYLMRAAARNGAKLVLIDSVRNPFNFRAEVWLKPPEANLERLLATLEAEILNRLPPDRAARSPKAKPIAPDNSGDLGVDAEDVRKAARSLAESASSFVIYGEGVLKHRNPALVASVKRLSALLSGDANRPASVALKRFGNSRAAWDLGLANVQRSIMAECAEGKVRSLLALLVDNTDVQQGVADSMAGVDFLAAISSYMCPVTAKASVVIPAPVWTESEGSYMTVDGLPKSTRRLLAPAPGMLSGVEILKALTKRVVAASRKESAHG